MTALVLGGTGFIGSRLVAALSKRRWRVAVVSRPGSRRRAALGGLAGVSVLDGDLTERGSVGRWVARRPADCVFSLARTKDAAGRRDPRADVRWSLELAAALSGSRRLRRWVRTALWRGGPQEAAVVPLLRDKYRLPVATLDLRRVYGPGQEPTDLIPTILRQAAAGAAVLQLASEPGDSGAQDLVHVDDVVRALLLAASAPDAVGRTIEIGSGRVRDPRQTAAEAARVLSRLAGRTLSVRWRGEAAGGEGSPADISQAAEWLGWRPRVTLAAGLRRLWRDRHGMRPAGRGAAP